MRIELYSEEELLKGCKKNKRPFQEILYKKYATKMYSICLSYAGDRDMAQDMLQEAFIKIFNKIHTFKLEGSLEGWIRRIVNNTAIDHLRKQTRLNNYITEKDEIEDDINITNGLSRLQTQDLMKQIARLPEGARAVFNLYVLEGYSHKEIAKKLNITEGTSKSQFNRARKLLIAWLNKLSA